MAVHNMDLLLLRVAVAGSLIVALMFVLPSLRAGGQDASTSAPADISYGMNCWCPDHFTDSNVRFTDATCRDKFISFARNESDSGIYVPISSVIPSDARGIDPELQQIRDLIKEQMEPHPNKKSQEVKGLLSSYTSVLIQLGISVVIYAIASWVRAAASSSSIQSCIKTVRAGVLRSNSEENAAAEDKDILQPSEGVASARLTSLSRSSTLAIIYLLLHLVAALMWFILCGVNHHNASLIAASASSASNQAALDTTPASLTGQIFCDFQIRKLSNIQRYTVQCSYEVQISPKENGANEMQDMTVDIAGSNAALCLTLGVLGLLYIVNFFLFSAKSHWNSMNPILQQAGIKTASGATFGSTDLYLAVALSD